MVTFISHNFRNFTSAGNQAKSDVEKIMESMGFRNIGLRRSCRRGKVAHFFRNLCSVVKASMMMRRGDVLFLQYPLKKYFSMVCRIARLRGVKTVALVHDLGSCRRKALTVDKEVARLNRADYVIATNPVMAERIAQMGVRSMIGSLDMWDNLSVPASDIRKGAEHATTDGKVHIAYAGSINRRKNSFLTQFGSVVDSCVVDIYGSGFDAAQVDAPEKFVDHGFVRSEELIGSMSGDYGLVWDGDSIDACTGDFGEYLALNTPHKVSLYVRAGVPVIIWSGAAMAPFVRDNRIGLTVGSLRDVDSAVAAVSPEEYAEMKRNVGNMSRNLQQGFYFRRAANAALEALK